MRQKNVLEYLEHTVKEVPDKTAYEDETHGLTFEQVYRRSRSIGSFIASKGLYNEPVIIFMKKTPEAVTAFFGSVYGGCYYVPIDEEMPKLRTDLILETLDAGLMICDKDTKEAASKLGFDGLVADYDEAASFPEDDDALSTIRSRQIDTDPIYVVFTSGSTGVPKGVVACHRSVIDYIEDLSEVLKVDRDTRFGNQSPFYFDACLKELYPTIKFGASAVIIPKQLFMFPVKLVEFLNEKKINTICWVVSALTMISGLNVLAKTKPQYLRTIAFGSEVFPIKQFKRWREALPDTRFINLYGPTEATGMSCWYEVDRDFEEGDMIPIGGPFSNTDIILLDENDKRSDRGEICIRGTALTLGYYKDRTRTDESFTENPLNDRYRELIYRTGDIAYRNDLGELVFCSRKDHQIKHMGHRIELGEIEAMVSRVEKVVLCCAVFDKIKDRISLYYTGEIEKEDLESQLKEGLPRYMLPHKVIRLDEMPLTPNGKIDRKRLATEGT
ncbi:MAG: amino acid adenylation domain-containing protein [Clostridiales bacterium]|nr:amino acid adenylation domain-containing protein [Clostridiales bacterium]MBR6483703.1 amino acid adenylation domain-containing protein [Clostridiales bacterium]